MIPRLMDRLARLEAEAAPPSTGKHLVFQVEAQRGTPVSDIVAFLKDRGHAIHDGDEVFVMNLGAYVLAAGEPIRDLSAELLTNEIRAVAPAAGKWPRHTAPFTFTLDRPQMMQ